MSKKNKSTGQNAKTSKQAHKQPALDEEVKDQEEKKNQFEEKQQLKKSKKSPIWVLSSNDCCSKEKNKKTSIKSTQKEQNSKTFSKFAIEQKPNIGNDNSKNHREEIPLPPPPFSLYSAALLQEVTYDQLFQVTEQPKLKRDSLSEIQSQIQKQQVADSSSAVSAQYIQSLISLASKLENTQQQITEKNVIFESQLQNLSQACKQQQTTIHQLYSLIQNFDVHALPEKKLYFRTSLIHILQQILEAYIGESKPTQQTEHQKQPKPEELEGIISNKDSLNLQGQSLVKQIQVIQTTELQQNESVQPLVSEKLQQQIKQAGSQQSKQRAYNNPESQLKQQQQTQFQQVQQSNVSTEQESTAVGAQHLSSIDIFLEDISLISHSPRQNNHQATNENSFESLKQQIRFLEQEQQDQKKKKDEKYVKIKEKEELQQGKNFLMKNEELIKEKEQVQKQLSYVSRKRVHNQKEFEKEIIEEGSMPTKKMKKI